jgi:hypothetical protein
LWSLFDTEEYARFLLRGSLLALASDNGEAVVVISKAIDDLHKSPIGGIDWRALKQGLGPPPDEHDYVVVYSAGGRFFAFWMPVIPVNPVFIAAFNAALAASVPALDVAQSGEVHTEGDDWTRVLRRLIQARKEAGAEGLSERADRIEAVVGRTACNYFPRLKTFSITERTSANGLVFSWLTNTVNAQSMDYPALLWVEEELARPIMYADTGAGLGAPVLVVALELSAGVERRESPFLGVFTPNGHRTIGKATVHEFRKEAWATAMKYLGASD